MTYHIRTPDYHCSKCDWLFIPFEKGLVCPKCATPEESDGESYHFIDNLIQSMKVHKRQFGTYEPPVWIQSTHTEVIQRIIFEMFDHLTSHPGKRIQDHINMLRLLEAEREHQDVRQLRKILTILKERQEELKDTEVDAWKEKMRNWIRQFLP